MRSHLAGVTLLDCRYLRRNLHGSSLAAHGACWPSSCLHAEKPPPSSPVWMGGQGYWQTNAITFEFQSCLQNNNKGWLCFRKSQISTETTASGSMIATRRNVHQQIFKIQRTPKRNGVEIKQRSRGWKRWKSAYKWACFESIWTGMSRQKINGRSTFYLCPIFNNQHLCQCQCQCQCQCNFHESDA